MNKWTGAGYISEDPAVKEIKTGRKMAVFTIACRRRKQKDSESREQDADFIRCVAWGKTAEVVENYARKGTYVIVAARACVRSYEGQDGAKRWVHEMQVEELELGPRRNSGGSDDFDRQAQAAFGGSTGQDEDIPF